MRVLAASAVLTLTLAASAAAQTAMAPWFDADGFYNRPEAGIERVGNDLAACRIEAARLKNVRNTNTNVGTAMAFNADGSYNAAVSGAATGFASIIFAIQDARYNGSIEQVEFRDCAVALGYRHYRLDERDRAQFNSQTDQGFAALVAAATPADGRLNQAETERNFFAAGLAERPYQIVDAPAGTGRSPAGETMMDGASSAPQLQSASLAGVVARVASGQVAVPQPGMAIVVASARQFSGAMQMPSGGDTFRFRRVPRDGGFLDLLQPSISFGLRSHYNPERRHDPTLAGAFDEPRYSTYLVPAGSYVLSDLGALNACLGTLAFDVADGDVLYLGDFVLRPPSIPISPLFNPLANMNSGMDNRLRADLRVDIGDDIEAARQALQADDAARARLTRVAYRSGYRIACDGRYVGRVANLAWPQIDHAQADAFHDAMVVAASAAH